MEPKRRETGREQKNRDRSAGINRSAASGKRIGKRSRTEKNVFVPRIIRAQPDRSVNEGIMKLLHEGGFGHRLDELASPKEKDSSISTSLIVHTTTKCIAPICVGYRAERTTGHNGLLDRVLLKCNPTVCVCRERPFGSIMVKKKKKRKKRLRGPKTTEGSPSSSLPGGKKNFFLTGRENSG